MKLRFQCRAIKFYWHTATLIHLGIVWGYFYVAMAESNGCDRDQMAPHSAKNIDCLNLCKNEKKKKMLLIPGPNP